VIGSATPRMPGTIRGPLRVGLVRHHSSVNEENLRQAHPLAPRVRRRNRRGTRSRHQTFQVV